MDDKPYREDSLELCFGELGKPLTAYCDLSLTDRVLRAALADPKVRVDAILTFNGKDFVDVCQKCNRRIVS
jgi:hypothetical protein